MFNLIPRFSKIVIRLTFIVALSSTLILGFTSTSTFLDGASLNIENIGYAFPDYIALGVNFFKELVLIEPKLFLSLILMLSVILSIPLLFLTDIDKNLDYQYVKPLKNNQIELIRCIRDKINSHRWKIALDVLDILIKFGLIVSVVMFIYILIIQFSLLSYSRGDNDLAYTYWSYIEKRSVDMSAECKAKYSHRFKDYQPAIKRYVEIYSENIDSGVKKEGILLARSDHRGYYLEERRVSILDYRSGRITYKSHELMDKLIKRCETIQESQISEG